MTDPMERYASAHPDPYDAAIEYAEKLGREHGKNAAGWYWGSGDYSPLTYQSVLQGIEDDDLAVLDTFPQSDLSGKWADSLTGIELTMGAIRAAAPYAPEWSIERFLLPVGSNVAEWVPIHNDICDAYEKAFSQAVFDEIARIARYHLESVESVRRQYEPCPNGPDCATHKD